MPTNDFLPEGFLGTILSIDVEKTAVGLAEATKVLNTYKVKNIEERIGFTIGSFKELNTKLDTKLDTKADKGGSESQDFAVQSLTVNSKLTVAKGLELTRNLSITSGSLSGTDLVDTTQIKNGAVTKDKLSSDLWAAIDGALPKTGGTLASLTVTGETHIQDKLTVAKGLELTGNLSITSGSLSGTDLVNTAQIKNGAVTKDKLSISTEDIASLLIGTDLLQSPIWKFFYELVKKNILIDGRDQSGNIYIIEENEKEIMYLFPKKEENNNISIKWFEEEAGIQKSVAKVNPDFKLIKTPNLTNFKVNYWKQNNWSGENSLQQLPTLRTDQKIISSRQAMRGWTRSGDEIIVEVKKIEKCHIFLAEQAWKKCSFIIIYTT